MFFLLGGQIVHDGENASQIMIQAATVKARSLASVASSAPQSVAYLVDRALAFQKADRWPSAAAMRDATHEAYIAIFGRPITREALAVMWSETDETQAMTREGVRAAQAAARVAPQAVAATRDASLPAVRPVPTHDALVPGVRPVSTLVEPPPTDRASGPSGTHRVTWAAAPIQAPRFDLVGGTTSQPVSSATAPMPAAGVAPKRGRVVLAIGIAAGLLLLGGAAASGLRAMGDGHGAALAPPPTAAPIPSATAVASTAIAASFPSAQPEPPDAGTLASSKAPAATRPALTAATPARPPTTATSTAVPATSPKPNCDVPFQVDSQGIQRIRPECKKQ
jgi:serine/threonine-protein kinase